MIVEFAPAKVNLWLRVVGRRGDGYHLLDSLVTFAAVGDTLRAAAAPALTLTLDGPFAAGVPAGDANLVLRAARALAGAEPRGAALRLTKRLPPASGLGGGSADAAAALRALPALWRLDAARAVIAPTLGADVPVCLASRDCRMQGIGERLTPCVLPPAGIVLANPGVQLETAAVFAARRGAFSAPFAPRAWADAAALAADIRAVGNDLAPGALALCPPIADVLAALAALPGSLCAAMSGSGATCFALFGDTARAAEAAQQLPAAWWCWGGGLHARPAHPPDPAVSPALQ